jgi:hypothetical protein
MWNNASYNGVTVDNWRSMKEQLLFKYKGKVEINTFCHQIPKLKEKAETVYDFPKKCIRGMRGSIDSIAHPADNNFDAEYPV